MKPVVQTIFTIALLISLANSPAATSQEFAIEQTATQQEPKFIPSPFAVAPHMTAVPELDETVDHSVELEEYAGSKKIKFRSYFLSVGDATRKQILDIVGGENLAIASGKVVSDWKPTTPQAGDENSDQDFAVARKSVLKGHPIRFGQIQQQKFEQVERIIKANSDSKIVAAPAVVAHENQTGSVMDGALVPFLVSVQPVVEDTTVHQGAIFQNIEEGTILRQKAKILEDAMQVDIHMIENTITKVDTFTFDGSGDPVTIQLPTCDCVQVKCVSRLEDGNVLFIDSNIPLEYEFATESKMLGGLLKNKKVNRKTLNRMIVVSAEVIE